MIDEILNVIKEKLPESTAGVLRDYLIKCQGLEKQNAKFFEDIKDKNIQIEKLKEENKILNGMRLCAETNERNRKGLEEREIKLNNTILEIQLKSTQESLSNIYHLVETVFKNPKMTYTKSGNNNTSWYSETTTMEEIK